MAVPEDGSPFWNLLDDAGPDTFAQDASTLAERDTLDRTALKNDIEIMVAGTAPGTVGIELAPDGFAARTIPIHVLEPRYHAFTYDDMEQALLVEMDDRNDNDGDGIPDFADGYDYDGDGAGDDAVATVGEQFVPLVLTVPETVDPGTALFKFTYKAAHPMKAGLRTGLGTVEDPFVYDLSVYDEQEETMRLWTRSGDTLRNGDSVLVGKDTNADGVPDAFGDFIPDGTTIPGSKLPFQGRSAVLWLEGIHPGERVIKVAADPDGPNLANPVTKTAPFLASDEVKATIVKVETLHPTTQSTETHCHRYKNQVLVGGAPEWMRPYCFGTNVEPIHGDVQPSPPLGCRWTLEAAAGTLADETDASPAYAPPATPGEGFLRLAATLAGTDTEHCEEVPVQVFRDHIERDIVNFAGMPSGSLAPYDGFVMLPGDVKVKWVCHNASHHAYNGEVASGEDDWWSAGGLVQVWQQTITNGTWTMPAGEEFKRYDIIAYYGSSGLKHSQIATGPSSAWSTNNISIAGHPNRGLFCEVDFVVKPGGYYDLTDFHTYRSDYTTIKVFRKIP